jgi:hypothetical protein
MYHINTVEIKHFPKAGALGENRKQKNKDKCSFGRHFREGCTRALVVVRAKPVNVKGYLMIINKSHENLNN